MLEFRNRSVNTYISRHDEISDVVIEIYVLVVCGIIGQVINIFGIVTNVINIVCFTKQGLKDPINISLLGLSASDLASLITMVMMCIFICPAFAASDLSFESYDVAYLLFAVPHFAFTRVSSCITAMITLERCLSISQPLKVKTIVTPQKTSIIIVCIFIIFTCSSAPIYVVNKLGTTQSRTRNKSVIGLIYRQDREQIDKIALSLNNFVIPFATFVIIILCTLILAFQLHRHTAWRKATVTQAQADKVSNRNQKVGQMVVFISILFIICFVPNTTIMFAIAFEPSLFINGKYLKITQLLSGFICILESINSSSNIFIYYTMSSKYRDTFRKLFVRLIH